ncbi:MAG: hypothetical protein AAB380_03235 [Verrucomicrobiota bacterium]
MFFRCINSALVAALIAAAGAGCKKSEPGPGAPSASSPPEETVARVHWLGKNRLAADTNAASFMDIWKLPESARLETQTLDKLSLAPWRLLKGDAATNGAPVARLRPLLDDLVQEESYVEVRNATNQPGELVLAIRLSPERSDLWETNLAVVLESLTGVRPVVAPGDRRGWSLKIPDAPRLIELARAGDWTVIGLAPEQNTLLAAVRARLERDHVPFAARTTDFWLEADFDLRRVAGALAPGWDLPEGLPRASLTVIGAGRDVLTRGQFNFAGLRPFELEAWNIPTNLVHDPLISFTAIRGVRPWLASLKMWHDLQLGPPPNQLFFWALKGFPIQTYFAAPLPDASNRVHAITERLVQKVNPWMTTNAMGNFASAKDFNGAVWAEVPFMSPFLRSVDAGGGSFAFGSLFPDELANYSPPAELLHQILGRTNLVAYDWELTGMRIESWIYMGQTFRLVFNKAQLPAESAGMTWLKAIAPRLGNCATAVTRTGAEHLSLARNSSVGFTAVELHALADWLESPQFPRGSHTALAPPPP